MATIIVVASVALAALFSLAWWLRPALRRQIEAPSQRFAAAAKHYDRACYRARRNQGERSNGSD